MLLYVLYGKIQHNTNNRQNVTSLWNGQREEKKFSHICNFFFSIKTCKAIQKMDRVWHHEFELRKRRNFFAKLQNKAQKSVWKEINHLTKLCQHKSNKNNDNDSEVEEIEQIHQENYLLIAKSKFDVALQLFFFIRKNLMFICN